MPDSRLSHCKLCEVADFAYPELGDLIRDIFAADREHFGGEFPIGHEYRKYWEVAMTIRAFRAFGALREDADVLGVGAGHEATIYWLTRQVGRVVATDLYEQEDAWSNSDSGSEMLTDPGRYWDGPWNPERLEVRHMSGLELDYDDESFDAIFSSSSIEHFGDFKDVRRSVEEMFRVLRPGGVAALATEFRLKGPDLGFPGLLRFDEPELRSLLLDGLWWDPATPLDMSISAETVDHPVLMRDAVVDIESGSPYWSQYPHIVLRDGRYLWTSVHIALIKSGLPASEWRDGAPKLPPKYSLRQVVGKLRQWAGKRAYRLILRLRKALGRA